MKRAQRIERKTAILAAWQTGLRLREIADRLAVSYSVVQFIVARGIPVAERKARHGEYLRAVALSTGTCDGDRDVQIVADRQAGMTMEEIGAKYGISRERVRQLLNRAWPDRPHDHGRSTDIQARFAARERAREIARTTGPHSPTARNAARVRKLDALRALTEQLGHRPSGDEIDASDLTPYAVVYYVQFGSLKGACEAAGIEYGPDRRRFSRFKKRASA